MVVLSEKELSEVFGGAATSTCKWEVSHPWGGYVVGSLGGALSGAGMYGTVLGASGYKYSDAMAWHVVLTLISGIVGAGLNILATWLTNDCYKCTPDV